MKTKLVLSFLFIFFSFVLSAQVNIVNVPQTPQETNVELVNGVPITEDIGGVDIEYEKGMPFVRNFTDRFYRERHSESYDNLFIKLTNYNDFPVTVYYEMSYMYLSPQELQDSGEWTSWYKKWNTEKGKIVLPPATNEKYPTKYIAPQGSVVMIKVSDFKSVVKGLKSR